MDDGETCIDVGLDQITPAFPVGTRVAIDWDSDGHWVYGVVTAFNQLWYVTFINILFSLFSINYYQLNTVLHVLTFIENNLIFSLFMFKVPNLV